MKKVRFIMSAFLTIISTSVFASNLAVVDSGLDVEHKDLSAKVWLNPLDSTVNSVDEDSNGFIDDINGWNFAENNNILLEKKYLGTFSSDCYKFFDVQAKLLLGTATPEEKEWYKEKIQDQNFIKELTTFGNFIHGTHVSGIGTKDTNGVKVMGIKIIPTEQPGIGFVRADDKNPLNDMLLLAVLKMNADNMIKLMKSVGQYLQKENTDAANCSFGVSETQIRQVVRSQLQAMNDTEITDERVNQLASTYFKQYLMPRGKEAFGDTAPNTLWVFAAGNDGTDNSQLDTFPANVKLNNTITVAATYQQKVFAPFSNFSKQKVEVAAPGVIINSTIPGDDYLSVSGTSQAAPYVANIAAQVKEINHNLKPEEIKKIIMGTVDKKAWLAEKVQSSGVVNKARAVEAAHLSVSQSLSEAISTANQTIHDVQDRGFVPVLENIPVQPLPSPIAF